MSGYEDLESLDAYWKKAQKVLARYAEEVDKPYYNLVKAVQKVITDADISEAFITSICEIIKCILFCTFAKNSFVVAAVRS